MTHIMTHNCDQGVPTYPKKDFDISKCIIFKMKLICVSWFLMPLILLQKFSFRIELIIN